GLEREGGSWKLFPCPAACTRMPGVALTAVKIRPFHRLDGGGPARRGKMAATGQTDMIFSVGRRQILRARQAAKVERRDPLPCHGMHPEHPPPTRPPADDGDDLLAGDPATDPR